MADPNRQDVIVFGQRYTAVRRGDGTVDLERSRGARGGGSGAYATVQGSGGAGAECSEVRVAGAQMRYIIDL